MPSNDFLPFAIDPSANIITQGAWGALPARATGFVAGVAQSNQLNKAWRQATVMAAAIGDLILTYGGLDALDDGNIVNLRINFARTMRDNGLAYVVATGTANAWVLAPTPTLAAYASGQRLWVVPPATNTSTTVNANTSGLGDKRLKRGDGTDPAVGDLIGGRPYPVLYDGTNLRVLVTLPSETQTVIAANKSPFNVTRTVYTARVSLSGTGLVTYQTGTYTKKSATSQLIVECSTNLFATSTAAGLGRISGLPTNLEFTCKNADGGTSSAACTGSKIYAGLAAGAVNWTWSFGRGDALAWTSVVNPRTADASYMPAETTSFIQFSELEP